MTGVHSATVFRQDPLSSSSITSADLQLEIAVHSLDSEHISSGRTAMHGGDGIGATISQTCCSPNLRQNQQLSSSGSPQVSRKISDSDDESFCSAQSDVDTTLMSLDPAKTTVMVSHYTDSVCVCVAMKWLMGILIELLHKQYIIKYFHNL